ncbi:helix-turn-helix transcriptional regulator [Yersinia frederiksenii]|uniref:helix-turn-helix transcriptional regulator n=1 Tax=Yersinia frederiksenii TaxID=29484 RepID=UPI0005E11FEB|nr:LuxR C-terminal-related transcriptional regulator [Yersinia frederiksenii]CQJ04967.1 LuxR family transcriptional regulatory protein [Yersinia frederiksenii]
MINIIIFSKIEFINVAIRSLIENIIKSDMKKRDMYFYTCSSLADFYNYLAVIENPYTIFDSDGVINNHEMLIFLSVKKFLYNIPMFVLCKDTESYDVYKSSALPSQLIVSKIEKIEVIQYYLRCFFLSPKGSLDVNFNQIGKLKISELPYLTQRQKEVLRLVLLGFTNQGISDQLNVSSKTVSAHRMAIYTKFNVSSLSSLYRKVKCFYM